MFLIISSVICSIFYILACFFTISGFIGLGTTAGNPMYRTECLKKILYSFLIRVVIAFYWFIFVKKIIIVTIVLLTLGPILITFLIVLGLGFYYKIEEFIEKQKILYKEKNIEK